MQANRLMKQNIDALLRARGQTRKDLAVCARCGGHMTVWHVVAGVLGAIMLLLGAGVWVLARGMSAASQTSEMMERQLIIGHEDDPS